MKNLKIKQDSKRFFRIFTFFINLRLSEQPFEFYFKKNLA